MQKAIVTTGRVTGPRSVELDESVAGLRGDVEVILRPRRGDLDPGAQSVFDFLRELPSGTRTRGEIDSRVLEEREGWERQE